MLLSAENLWICTGPVCQRVELGVSWLMNKPALENAAASPITIATSTEIRNGVATAEPSLVNE